MSLPSDLATWVLLDDLTEMGKRFAGLDVQFRNTAPAEWRRAGIGKPYTWRIRILATKNERSDYRITGYGPTFRDAAESVLRQVAAIDGGSPWTPPTEPA